MIFDRQEFTTATTNGSGTIRESRTDAARRTIRELPNVASKIVYVVGVAVVVGLLLAALSMIVWGIVATWREII